MADITYCSNYGCENEACERNACHLKEGERRSFAGFPDCPHYKKFLKELAEQERRDAEAEAKRDMYRLDDCEDCLAYRHRWG